ncbi:MAG: GTP-binding protein [Candidatus Binatia bacterium]
MKPQAQALVVSGFLGSGKTTLVRSLLDQGRREGIRTAVVSNEFGELGIDEALLAAAGGDTNATAGVDYVELSGGCVCCRLSDDLLKTLQQLWERSRPERVIVETSGVGLPYDTLVNFWRDPVRAWAVDESSVVVVSAEQVAAGRDLDATFVDQVCSADLLLLSKTDLVSEGDADRAEAVLHDLQADVTILRASYGDVDSRVFFPPQPGQKPARAAQPAHQHDGHDHDEYVSEEVLFPTGIDEAALRTALEARSALRAKGFVQTSGGLRLVQGVAGRIEITAAGEAPPARLLGRIVVIDRRSRHTVAEDAAMAAHAIPGEPR